MESQFFLGVDVGTSSVRALLINGRGKRIALIDKPIKIWSSPDIMVGHYEQSTEDIWASVVKCVNEVVKNGNIDRNDIKGIGFDATTSLVALDRLGNPTSVNLSNLDEQNVILWMDHRAAEEADFINKTNHPVLEFVGGHVSLEMQMPKVLWLKRNLSPDRWNKIGMLFDLPDFLSYRATGCAVRSFCCLVCKWNYVGFETKTLKIGWCDSYLESIGLGELKDNNYEKIGSEIKEPGVPVGHGLSAQSAKELGLPAGTPVSTSLIDAHAGGIGMMGAKLKLTEDQPHLGFENRIGLICGTSACHMAISQTPLYVPGVWGPYFSAMVPGWYLNEGGQSVAGKLIDFVIETHPAYSLLHDRCEKQGHSRYELLDKVIKDIMIQDKLMDSNTLTKNRHVLPDFHGNRSPLARPDIRGLISGLSLESGLNDLAILYLSVIQSLAYSSKSIIERLCGSGYSIKYVFMCGGLSHNELYSQSHADVLEMPVIINNEEESVLMGSCILATVASKNFPSIKEAMENLTSVKKIIYPNRNTKLYHRKKYEIYVNLLQLQLKHLEMMKDF